QSHQSELEAAIAQLSGELAEHALLDQAECPELPAGTEPTPACAARAAHIDATLAEVTDALAARSRQKLRASERAHEHQRVLEAFESLVDDELAFVDVHPEGSVVRILVAKLYNENTTTLSPLGISIVERVASALDGLRDHHLDVIGHTDDVSVSSVTLPSNWELGFAYAVGVVRMLEDLGVTLDTHASSRAGNDPLLPPVDAEARRMNRRVELVLTPLEIELPVTETPHGPHPLTPPDDPAPEAPEAPEVAP
ncbi:MAG: hypothetical protein KC656_35965, partial [Myxococcales bacterium]|nr:hypothetical protein [Myxococcales bacterium]